MNWLRDLLDDFAENDGDVMVVLTCLIAAVAYFAGFIG